jgi:hypothetical protein
VRLAIFVDANQSPIRRGKLLAEWGFVMGHLALVVEFVRTDIVARALRTCSAI